LPVSKPGLCADTHDLAGDTTWRHSHTGTHVSSSGPGEGPVVALDVFRC
jgi:hypothetical protein